MMTSFYITCITIDLFVLDMANHPQLYIETPLLESYEMSKVVGCKVYLKMENLQPTHTFKIRGISNLLLKVCTQF